MPCALTPIYIFLISGSVDLMIWLGDRCFGFLDNLWFEFG